MHATHKINCVISYNACACFKKMNVGTVIIISDVNKARNIKAKDG
jgi:hypothetical protein